MDHPENGIDWQEVLRQRRIRNLLVAPEALLMLLVDAPYVAVEPGHLPLHWKLMSAQYSEDGRCFVVSLASPEFEAVPDGESIPNFAPMITRLAWQSGNDKDFAAAEEIIAVLRNNYRVERRVCGAVVGTSEIAGIIAKHLGRGSSWSIY